ncbi:transcription/translation regulatory transformer protein RfaH [Stutzerimonas xanthomarina]|uniref:transcription/translation regulatory transformer protein RfaH n=1 Tax=Stutzerimonas xanthomarina TaxID=271420 RepID=UPI003AA8B4CF
MDREAGCWYLIQCKVRQDERAEENLVRQGYECLRPTLACERVVRGKRQRVVESLFPGYLFIRLDAGDNWGPLRSTRGVLRLVGFGEGALPIDPEIILQLRQRAEQAEGSPVLVVGETVRIISGPFAELEAIFCAMDGDDRVVLLLKFLQREQRVRVPLGGIAAKSK